MVMRTMVRPLTIMLFILLLLLFFSEGSAEGDVVKHFLGIKDLLLSNESVYSHLDWGSPARRRINGIVDMDKRIYFGFGQCPSRWPVHYEQHIKKASELQLIMNAYTEMMGQSCREGHVKKLTDLFEKGYARLQTDHSVTYSNHTLLFIKQFLTYQDMDDLEKLMELSAFSQTFVAWFKFPVNPMDPLGNELSDSCFIEIVARLHVLDLTVTVTRRHMEHISYLMGVKMKPVLKLMCEMYKAIKGNDQFTEKMRKIAKQCLVVSMALLEFLFKWNAATMKEDCAHTAFKKFFKITQKAFQGKAEMYGRMA